MRNDTEHWTLETFQRICEWKALLLFGEAMKFSKHNVDPDFIPVRRSFSTNVYHESRSGLKYICCTSHFVLYVIPWSCTWFWSSNGRDCASKAWKTLRSCILRWWELHLCYLSLLLPPQFSHSRPSVPIYYDVVDHYEDGELFVDV